jgi:hypothetical protein
VRADSQVNGEAEAEADEETAFADEQHAADEPVTETSEAAEAADAAEAAEPLPWDIPAAPLTEQLGAASRAEAQQRDGSAEPPEAEEPLPPANAAEGGTEPSSAQEEPSAGRPTVHIISDSGDDGQGEPRRGWWRRLVK